ncbi:MAG: hypothetical protein I8H75_02175 [Myxococcaceae bacterium]|nr:hypothetical protein [Myxococcaceae bacterium]MBH2006143.1 hypothetical protein [Myxococcaceae bacterium]
MPITLERPEIRLPEELRAPILRKPDEIKTSENAPWTPVQIHIAEMLQDLFKGKDSFELSSNPINRSIEDLEQTGIQVNSDSKTISYQGHTFALPSALQIDSTSNSVRYIPKVFSAPAQSNLRSMPLVHKTTFGAAPLDPTPVLKAIQNEAQSPPFTKPSFSPDTASTSQSSARAQQVILPEASQIISSVSQMQQAIAGARLSETNKRLQNQTIQNAVQMAAERTVGSIVANQSALDDNRQQKQQDRGLLEFASQAEQENQSVTKSGQSAGPHQGKK